MMEMAQYLSKARKMAQVFCFIGDNYLVFWGTYYLTSLCNWDPIFNGVPITIQFLVKLTLCVSTGTLLIVFKDSFMDFFKGRTCLKIFD